ncbi:MAG: NAD-dependent epimerase/dehydratase family protein [Mucinivorans sp.]
MNRRVLITGANGLVGSYVVMELLHRVANENPKNEIHCITRNEAQREESQLFIAAQGISNIDIIYHTIDLEDFQAVRDVVQKIKPDVVFHTAARVAVGEENGSATGEKMVRTNVDITHFVCQTLLELRAEGLDPLLVHVSSVAALADSDPRGMIDHTTPFIDIVNASPYARSKFLSQNDVLRAQKMGLRTVIICPSVIIGIHNKKSQMERMFGIIARGMKFYTPGEMGYVDVRDVARAMVELSGNKQAENEIYCLNGKNLTFQEFFTIFGEPFGNNSPQRRIGERTLKTTVWLLDKWSKITGTKPLITRQTARHLTHKSRYDGSKIEATLPDFHYTLIENTAQYVAEKLRTI